VTKVKATLFVQARYLKGSLSLLLWTQVYLIAHTPPITHACLVQSVRLFGFRHDPMSTEKADPAYEVATSYEIPQKAFRSIEYPGYVRPASVPRAIARLGGEKLVSEAFRKNLNVDLKLHDPGKRPFAHPPSGKTVEVQNLVLKVTRRKRKGVVAKRGPENSVNDVEMQDTVGEQQPPLLAWEGMPFANALREATTSKGEFKIEVLGRLQKTMRFRSKKVALRSERPEKAFSTCRFPVRTSCG
jgi:hypothetical protein